MGNGYGVCSNLASSGEPPPLPLLHKTTLTMVLGLEIGPMYATDRRQSDVGQNHHLMPPPYGGEGIIGETVHRFKIKSKTKLNLHSEV